MKRKTTPLKKSALPPSITKSEIDAEYAKLFPPDTPLLPGEMTLSDLSKLTGRGHGRLKKEVEAHVKAGTMGKRENVYIRGQAYTTYYLIQRTDNNGAANKRKRQNVK